MTIAMQATAYNIPQPGNPKMRLRDEGLTEQERKYALAIHLTALLGAVISIAFVVPIVLWFVHKDKSAFVDDHGREMMNVFLTAIVLMPILAITIIGIPFVIVWVITTLIGFIRGAIAASSGEYFRYPMTIRFLS